MDKIKNQFMNVYASYRMENNFKNLNKKVDELSDYATHDKKDISVNSELIITIDYALECVCKNQSILEQWQAMSNTQKRKHIASAFKFCVVRKYYRDKDASTKTQNASTKNVRVRVNEFLWQIVLDLAPNTITIDK